MFRIDDPSAATSLPTPEATGTEGYWTEGNPGSGVPATLERASWFNMIQEELRSVVVAGGLTPSKTTYNQLLLSLRALYGNGRIGHTYAASDWMPLGGGLILQWMVATVTASNIQTFALPTPFPSAFLGVLASGYGTGFASGNQAFVSAIPNGLSQVNIQNLYSASSVSVQILALGR